MPAPAFRASTTTTDGGVEVTSLTGTIPTGTTTGDVMVAVVGMRGVQTVSATPTGWTQILTRLQSDIRLYVYQRVWQSGDAGPTFNFSAATRGAVSVLSYSEADTAAPVNASGTDAGIGGAFATEPIAPSVTTTVADTRLLFIGAIEAGSGAFNWAPPSGMTERLESEAAYEHMAADEARAASGATGTRMASVNAALVNWVAAAVALAPTTGGVTGSAANTLPALASTATATAQAAAAAESVLSALTTSATGTATASATATSTLPGLQTAATAAAHANTACSVLPALTSASTGLGAASGVAVGTLPALVTRARGTEAAVDVTWRWFGAVSAGTSLDGARSETTGMDGARSETTGMDGIREAP